MGKKRTHKGKLFAFVGMAVLGLSAVLFITQTKAQASTTPFQCGSINNLVSSNQPSGSGGVYVSGGGTRIGKIYNGVLTHDSYTSTNGVGNSVSPGIVKIGSGNSTGQFDFWIVCGDGQMVQVYMPSIGAGYGLCVATDGSTYYIPPTPPYNSEQGSCSSAIFTGANLRRANDGSGTTPQPPPPDLTPPTITSPTATNITQTGALITWSTNENSDSQVEYGTTASYGSATTLDANMTMTHSVNLIGLTAGTAYNYKVKSRDSAGNLSYVSSTFTTLSSDTSPPSIYSINVSNITQTSAVITWSTTENADTQVEYGTSLSYGSATTLDATMTATHSVNLTGLTPGTQYSYQVKSRDAAGNLATSRSSPFSTLSPSNYSFNWTLHTAAGSLETKTPNRAKTVMKLENTGNTDMVYTVFCTTTSVSGSIQLVNADGSSPAPFSNNRTSVSAATSKYLEFGFDVGSLSPGTIQVTCEANRDGANASEKKIVTDTVTLIAPVVTPGSDTPATVVASVLSQYGANKYSLKVDDPDGIKEFLIKKAGGTSIYGGSPGASGNIGVCGGNSTFKSVDSGTVTLESADFPLQASVTDCRTGAAAYSFNVPAPSGTTPMTLSGTIFKDGQYIDPATSTTRTCVSPNGWMKEGPLASGARGFHCMPNYTPIATDNPPTPCVGTLYTTGISSGSFTTDYCSTTAPGVTTPPTPVSCAAGEKCASGSWCNNGQKCFYPDSQITCVAWPSGPAASSVSCPSGTSTCDPSDANCVAPGQTTPYVSGKWCSQSQSYYSTDGKNMTCVAWGGSAPSGFSVCRPDDRSCIPENGYGPSSGSCYNSMKCYQKASDSNANNDVYCSKSPSPTAAGSMYPEPTSCPSGYGSCSPTDTNCKEKGESWTDANSGYYCSGGQKCTSASGGGSCVGWNESCPAGTKYCDANSESCIEPGEYKTLRTSGGGSMSNNYWCGGGGGGMVFYSSTQAYCEKKTGSASGSMTMMWSGEDIKAVLNKLGSGWGLCSPGNSNCIEPGKTGPSSGWCAWYPPGTGGYTPPMSSPLAEPRVCPALDGSTPKPPPPEPPLPCGQAITRAYNPKTGECKDFPNTCIGEGWVKKDCKISPPMPPVPEERECNPGEVPSPINMCRMPRYRWSYAEKKFEKCERIPYPIIMNAAASTSSMPMPEVIKPGYTSCQYMNYELEVGWRTKRYLAHPPEKDGEWYMPPWDAAYDRLRYSPDKDALEECSAKDSAYLTKMMPLPDTWIGPCQPVPPEDKEWMLEMYRFQYKMFLKYKDQWSKPGPNPEPVTDPFPEPTPVPLPDPGQCKPYLSNVRQGLVGDKQFWRDVNRKFNEVKGTYAEADKVSELLTQAKALIMSIDKAAKRGGCGKEALEKIQDNLDKLHTEIFSELSAHLTDMEELGQFARCRTRLEQLGEEAKMFALKTENNEDEEFLQDLTAQIADKAEEFGQPTDEDLGFDAAFECESFIGEIEGQLMRFRINLNEDTRRVSDAVIERLGTHIETLTQDLSKAQKQIDELVVQVAQLKKTAEDLTQAAKDVSDRLVTSYTALAQMNEKFEEDRRQILAEKNQLVTLVEEAMGAMKDSGCVRVAADRDRLATELGQVATVNWTPARGEQLEKRLQLIIDSCRAKDFTREDMNGFFASLTEAQRANMAESYRRGYTPFADVPTHEWYYGGMTHAYENGYMTKSMPGESALAQDALLMVLRAAGAGANEITGDCTLNAPQVRTVSPYAVCAANYASKKGLPLQSNMTLPVERIRIAQWITLLKPALPKRADDAVDFNSFVDIQSLGNDTRFVAYMYANGVMVGTLDADGKRRFEPHVSLTRAALAVVLDQLRRVSGESETH